MSERGIKHDRGKEPLSLIPKESLFKVADVLNYGASKYGKYNFRKGLAFTRLTDAALRHIYKWLDGENLDEESGKCHIAHAATNLIMLLALMKDHPSLDDRYKADKVEDEL